MGKNPWRSKKYLLNLETKRFKMQFLKHNIQLVERNSQLAPKADRLFAYTGCWYGPELHRWFPWKVDVWWEPGCNKSNRVFHFTNTYGFVAQFGRASDLHRGGRVFESHQIHEYDKLVKLVCRLTFRMFFVWGISAMVERFHGMEEVYRFESDMLQYIMGH